MRKSFFITAFLIAVALGSLLLLAFNQFQLYGKHEQIISQTEKLIFKYSTIREQIIGDIVENRITELSQISSSVEELHNNIINVLDNKLIPAEYKFSFMQQIDLPGLVLLLRKTSSEKADSNVLRLINEETRIIGERFMLLERLILSYAKQKLVDFQLIIIGILALVVFLVTVLMLVTYRLLILPVVDMSSQFENILNGRQSKITNIQGWDEVSGLSDKTNRLLDEFKGSSDDAEQHAKILRCCLYVLRKIHGVKNSADLYQVACRALLSNTDYILAWIGVEDREGGGISPVAADGSSTMTGEECQECFGALLAAQEGDNDPVHRAFISAETATGMDILATVPKGPFKNTPMATGNVGSISVPIAMNGKTFAVLTVYTMSEGDVLDQETELLSVIADLLAAKSQFFNVEHEIKQDTVVKNLISEKSDMIVFGLDQTGTVVNVDTYPETSRLQKMSSAWIGCHIADLISPETDPEKAMFRTSLKKLHRYDFNAKLSGMDGLFTSVLAPFNGFPADDVTLLLVLVAPQKNILIQPESFQVAYSAAIGQFASTIAHEITDLSNGVINYAQMLSDEIRGEQDGERKKYLKKIIEGGEKVAGVVEPLLVEQNDIEYSGEREEVRKVFDDVLILTGHLLRRDGVSVKVDIQPVSLLCRKQHLQLMLLTLLNHLLKILNRYVLQEDMEKALVFSVSQIDGGSQEMIRVEIALPGNKDAYQGGDSPPDQSSGIWLCKELARILGGEIELSLGGAEKMHIELILPS